MFKRVTRTSWQCRDRSRWIAWASVHFWNHKINLSQLPRAKILLKCTKMNFCFLPRYRSTNDRRNSQKSNLHLSANNGWAQWMTTDSTLCQVQDTRPLAKQLYSYYRSRIHLWKSLQEKYQLFVVQYQRHKAGTPDCLGSGSRKALPSRVILTTASHAKTNCTNCPVIASVNIYHRCRSLQFSVFSKSHTNQFFPLSESRIED
jgi:hypothetical protein